jgi:Molecular chaperone
MSKVVGIDLGTTNSLVAYVRTACLRSFATSRATASCRPSCRSGDEGTVHVGREAQRRLLIEAQRTVYSVKRFMGKGRDDVQDEAGHFPFRIGGDGGVLRIGVGDKEFTPPEISALRARELKHRAEAFFAEQGEFDNEVDRAVITVPATSTTRSAPRRATPAASPASRSADHQRADRGVAGLRPRQAPRRRHRGLRPRRRHVRHFRSSASRTASSRCSRPTATRTSAATTSTTC